MDLILRKNMLDKCIGICQPYLFIYLFLILIIKITIKNSVINICKLNILILKSNLTHYSIYIYIYIHTQNKFSISSRNFSSLILPIFYFNLIDFVCLL